MFRFLKELHATLCVHYVRTTVSVPSLVPPFDLSSSTSAHCGDVRLRQRAVVGVDGGARRRRRDAGVVVVVAATKICYEMRQQEAH